MGFQKEGREVLVVGSAQSSVNIARRQCELKMRPDVRKTVYVLVNHWLHKGMHMCACYGFKAMLGHDMKISCIIVMFNRFVLKSQTQCYETGLDRLFLLVV